MSDVIVTPEMLRTRIPAFADTSKYTDETLSGILDTATCYVSTKNCGPLRAYCREQAICLMAAHLLTLRERTAQGGNAGVGGAVASASVGNVSISMVTPPNQDQYQYWMNQTPYGAELMRLLAIYANGGLYVGGSFETVLR
jgi:hypothetical protein|nr:MAG TPA: head to tail adaptor [Caudoviricetes sp.]